MEVSKFFKLLKRHFHHQICHFTICLCHFELLSTYILWRLVACFKFLPGFQTLEELYYKTWLHSGQRVIIQEKNGNKVLETVVTIQGLTPSGYLLAIGEDNQMCELHPDGNSFDFFKGLVRRKIE
ncbi:biotin--protein ligase 2-like isoform X2 [Populus alba x Populus x berolinensis]|nr:biotin--protein ligase 2-like isoform X2 [Populus alba x Populus x berolinensis]